MKFKGHININHKCSVKLYGYENQSRLRHILNIVASKYYISSKRVKCSAFMHDRLSASLPGSSPIRLLTSQVRHIASSLLSEKIY